VLVQETIYESMLHRRRTLLHQQAAEAIEKLYQANLPEYYGQLAYHYQLSHADEKAVEYLLKAGEKARSSYLNAEAVAYFQQALERLNRPSGGALGSRLPALGESWSFLAESREPGAESRSEATWRLAALTGLGQVHMGVGEIVEAERFFRQAILVGHEIGLPPGELVRLYFRLGDVLYWHNRWDELIRIGEEGLSLLGEDTRSVEAALMNHIAAVGYSKRQPEKHWELSHRNAQFLQDLPYSEELRPVFYTVAGTYRTCDRNAQEALKWMEALELRAEQHHDVRALVDAAFFRGDLLLEQGDLEGALRAEQRGRELSRRIGDIKAEAWCLGMMGRAFLALGDLQQAEACGREALEIMVGDESDIAHTLMVVATVSRCRGSWEDAAAAFERAAQLFRGVGSADAAWTACALGRVSLARGERRKGLGQFQEAINLAHRDVFALAAALGGLEEASDAPENFRAFCERFREEHSAEGDHRFVQWFLRPAEVGCTQRSRVDAEFSDILSADWIWQDPFADCCYSVQQGLVIHAANGRDLFGLNRSGPRLMRRVAEGFTVETVCTPAAEDKPALGGILCWRDARNFLRLDRGTGGEHEISFTGCVGNRDLIVGRGRLSANRVVLRMEQRDGRVTSLCSMDGRDWFSLGQVEFGAEEPMQVGLYAVGRLDRTLYPGAYREGTAIRFESFRLWH
jgi:tetratricopeptide (TPR) repeat protein